MQEAGHRLPAHGGRNLWRLALWGRARGEKARGCPLKAHGAGGRWGHLPPVEQDGHPPSAGQCRHPRQPGSRPARGAYWWCHLECNFPRSFYQLYSICTISSRWSMCALSLKYTLHQQIPWWFLTRNSMRTMPAFEKELTSSAGADAGTDCCWVTLTVSFAEEMFLDLEIISISQLLEFLKQIYM